MKLPHLEKISALPILFGLSFVVFGWFVLSLALSSLFSFPLIAIGATLLFALTTLLAWKLVRLFPRDLQIAALIALVTALSVGYTTEPTIFSGRDQGSIAEAAYRLATNTELAFSTDASDSFFQIYGPGTALNFPGFAYTEEGYLITQFPLGYTAWLGSFVSLFGLSGLAIGNTLLLFLFLFFFYQLLRLFVHPYYAGAGLVLAATSFLPNWFAKISLTENLALFLFVFLAYSTILFLREGKFLSYIGILLSAGLLAFTRIEGFAVLFLALILIAFHPHTRSLFRTYPWKSVVIPGLLFSFFFLRDFFLNLPYYKMIGKALFKFLRSFSDSALASGTVTSNSFGLGSVFFLYGFLTLAIVGFFGILYLIKKKQWLILVPVFIALPTFLYLFSPNITPDHPWMLRRYLFTLFPTLLFSAVMCIALLFSHEQKSVLLDAPRGKRFFFVSIIFFGLLLLQIPAWSTQFTYAENRGLYDQIEVFSQQFSPNDLILVDQNATGDGFTMLTGPGQFLFGKNTVYFFNPYDLPALDTSRFERIFLLTPEESQGRYGAVFGERLIYKQSVTFTLEQFESVSLNQNPTWRFPKKSTINTKNLLFQVY